MKYARNSLEDSFVHRSEQHPSFDFPLHQATVLRLLLPLPLISL